MRARILVLALLTGCLLAVAAAWVLRLSGVLNGVDIDGLSSSMIGAGAILIATGLRLAVPSRGRPPAPIAVG